MRRFDVMMMNIDEKILLRNEHPMDVVEQMASLMSWRFERCDDDEISLQIDGQWTDYSASFTWLPAMETLHFSCAFACRAPAARRSELMELIALANREMWLGHFSLWPQDGVIMFRQAQLLTGGALPSPAQCESMLNLAIKECERYYQAFQFVLWAGQSAKDALEQVMLETHGRA